MCDRHKDKARRWGGRPGFWGSSAKRKSATGNCSRVQGLVQLLARLAGVLA